jgi:plastocyanin
MQSSHFTTCATVILTSTATLSLLPVPRVGLAAQESIRVDIAIDARQFEPSPVSVMAGHEVQLILTNHDAKLHAFVPIRFLENLPLHLDGNGARSLGRRA